MYFGFRVFCKASLSPTTRGKIRKFMGCGGKTWLGYCEVASVKMTSLRLMRRPPSLLNPQNPHASQHLHSGPWKRVVGSPVSVHVIGELCANADKISSQIPDHRRWESQFAASLLGWGQIPGATQAPAALAGPGASLPTDLVSSASTPRGGQHRGSKPPRSQVAVVVQSPAERSGAQPNLPSYCSGALGKTHTFSELRFLICPASTGTTAQCGTISKAKGRVCI